jgi:FAD/FMN-containing dehydrogenase
LFPFMLTYGSGGVGGGASTNGSGTALRYSMPGYQGAVFIWYNRP